MFLQVLLLLLVLVAPNQACRCPAAHMTPKDWGLVVVAVVLGRRRKQHCRIRHIHCL